MKNCTETRLITAWLGVAIICLTLLGAVVVRREVLAYNARIELKRLDRIHMLDGGP